MSKSLSSFSSDLEPRHVVFSVASVRAPPRGSEEASDPDTFESIGSLAVHVVARFSLPRMQMMARDQEG